MQEQSIHERLIAALGREDDEVERALQLLYGELPEWFPKPRLEHARRIVYRLRNDEFSAEQIAEFVTAEMCGNEITYLLAHPAVARRDINELAHIKYALLLPDNECLEMLAGELAAFAVPFKNNSDKPRKPSPIRRAIARELKRNSNLKPRHLWEILASKPPKGWEFFDNSAGKYIEGPKGGEGMGYARFREILINLM